MPVPHHLVIPAARPPSHGPASAWTTSLPPQLRALLDHLAPAARIACAEDCPAMPHELLRAQLHGLNATPGLTPWAAFETQTLGEPCSWLHLCHWQVGMSAVTMTDPAALALDEATSRALLDAMAPYFAEDGITLDYWRPGTWLAKGAPLRELRCVSMDRVVSASIGDWQTLGGTRAEALLRRLQNEMQMLLYTLPLNDARERQGLPPVNAFWLTGAGLLETMPQAPDIEIEVDARLLKTGRNPAAHAQAWREVDADACTRLLAHLDAGAPVRLSLCGANAAQTFETPRAGAVQRLLRGLTARSRRARALSLLEHL